MKRQENDLSSRVVKEFHKGKTVESMTREEDTELVKHELKGAQESLCM